MLLIDVGARGGIHSRWNGIVDDRIGFDADADVNTGRPAIAIADAVGERPFHLLHARPCSSLHRPNESYLSRFPGALERFAIEDTRTVQTTTIDEIAPADAEIVLKLDVEGAERSVIAGAAQTLGRVVLIETEVWLAPVYHGGTQFHELHSDLSKAGFSLVTLRRCWWRDTTGVPHLTTGDAVYVRADRSSVPSLLSAYRPRRSRGGSAISAAGQSSRGIGRVLDGADADRDPEW